MIFVVLLQNCMVFGEGGSGSCIEASVECDVDGTEEVSINVDEAVGIKNEIPEAIIFPPIKTEHEVRLWVYVCVCVCVCVYDVVAAHAFSPFIAPKII